MDIEVQVPTHWSGWGSVLGCPAAHLSTPRLTPRGWSDARDAPLGDNSGEVPVTAGSVRSFSVNRVRVTTKRTRSGAPPRTLGWLGVQSTVAGPAACPACGEPVAKGAVLDRCHEPQPRGNLL